MASLYYIGLGILNIADNTSSLEACSPHNVRDVCRFNDRSFAAFGASHIAADKLSGDVEFDLSAPVCDSFVNEGELALVEFAIMFQNRIIC